VTRQYTNRQIIIIVCECAESKVHVLALFLLICYIVYQFKYLMQERKIMPLSVENCEGSSHCNENMTCQHKGII